MDKDTQLAINDILDALDAIVRNLRQTNPGRGYGDVEFYLDRVSELMDRICIDEAVRQPDGVDIEQLIEHGKVSRG